MPLSHMDITIEHEPRGPIKAWCSFSEWRGKWESNPQLSGKHNVYLCALFHYNSLILFLYSRFTPWRSEALPDTFWHIELATTTAKQPDWYFNELIDGHIIVWYYLPNDTMANFNNQRYYHSLYQVVSHHSDCKRLQMTIQARYHHPDIRNYVDKFHYD